MGLRPVDVPHVASTLVVPENRAVHRAADCHDQRRTEPARHWVEGGGYWGEGVYHRAGAVTDLNGRRR